MKIKTKMMKALAVTMSATMVMGMTTTAFATPDATVDAPIYSFNVENVVVPTTFAVAFNPDELTVKVGTGTSTEQVLSQNYGILNKSNKDKVVTVALTVADKNTDKIKFVDTAAEATGADSGEFAIYLTAVPADATEVKVGAASADKDTAAAALADVTMTKATGSEIKLSAGENKIAFLLEKATYSPKTGSEVTLGTSTSNDVQTNFELTAVAAAGKGITAFTFGGAVNKNADWYTLTQGIEISATYSFETAAGDETAVAGTGAMIEITSDAAFAEGTAVGTISYTVGEGSKALASITSITMDKNGTDFDGYHDLVKNWYAAKDEDGLITFDTLFVSAYASAYPDDTTREATVTYVTVGGETKTATVDVKLR